MPRDAGSGPSTSRLTEEPRMASTAVSWPTNPVRSTTFRESGLGKRLGGISVQRAHEAHPHVCGENGVRVARGRDSGQERVRPDGGWNVPT